MNSHLSQEQFARCFVGLGTHEERQHVTECAECGAELNVFGNTVSALRHGIRGRVDTHVESRATTSIPVSIQPATRGIRKLRWGLATAAVLFVGMVPFVTSEKPESVSVTTKVAAETSPDALMNAINAHLSRTVPAPMEPMMSLLPNDEPSSE
jgi:anti-sigma factor RsiW